jgi:predicted nucleotidyltransferase
MTNYESDIDIAISFNIEIPLADITIMKTG